MNDESTVTTHRPHETHEEEFSRLVRSVEHHIPVEFDPPSAAAIVALVQLAMRHPGAAGTPAIVGRRLADGLIDLLAKYCDDPDRMRYLLNLGYDPSHDVSVDLHGDIHRGDAEDAEGSGG